MSAGAFLPDQGEPCAMPYGSNSDLPASVQAHLPPHAQDIYREAFNHAFAAHADDPTGRNARIASLGRRSRAHT
jgi:cation transport regulator ChaB